MINSNTKLTILHDDNGSFVNYTEQASDYIRDTFSVALSATEDYLYIGFSKPFNSTFIAFNTVNTNANTLNAEYYNGTGWASLSLTDETLGFTRNGFLFWDRSVLKSTTINSIEAFYIRLRPSVDHSATIYRGINLVFSDDNDLKGEFFDIDNPQLLRTGETNHLVHHVASRNAIIQQLTNQNYKKRSSGNSKLKEINQWDLIDIFQVRQASIMLTLSKIFFLLADSQDDTWWAKYKEYQKRYEEAINLVTLSVDNDDDGEEDLDEANDLYKSQRWIR
jgi:hypothetical protein